MNKNNRDTFWETDLEDLQKTYLPDGKTSADLPFSNPDWRVPVQGSPLLAAGKVNQKAGNK